VSYRGKSLSPDDEIRDLHESFSTQNADEAIIRKPGRRGTELLDEPIKGFPRNEYAFPDRIRYLMLELRGGKTRVLLINASSR